MQMRPYQQAAREAGTHQRSEMCRKNKKDRPICAVCLWLFVKEFSVAAGTSEI